MAPFTLAVILEPIAQNASAESSYGTATFNRQTEFILRGASGILAMSYLDLDFEWSTNGAHSLTTSPDNF